MADEHAVLFARWCRNDRGWVVVYEAPRDRCPVIDQLRPNTDGEAILRDESEFDATKYPEMEAVRRDIGDGMIKGRDGVYMVETRDYVPVRI